MLPETREDQSPDPESRIVTGCTTTEFRRLSGQWIMNMAMRALERGDGTTAARRSIANALFGSPADQYLKVAEEQRK